ncbi:hypothetical protein NM688_g8392 [Phlebia brevispora]|uniref:Uncharacterized protein n=1 Tax=Phlebia brevispora TaxID=194682 RepID=A0ACC1RUJ0_9APHY|nr:hypothetical protein NM688_g8392 [Phlebia brevispora]
MSTSQCEVGPRPKKLRLSDLNNFVLSRETFIVRARPVLSHLPPDVWLLILSHFPKISREDITRNSGWTLPRLHRRRIDVLRALSQTCRTLRAFCLPLAWEHVEACIWDGQQNPRNRYLSYVLKRQCYGLVKYPDIASHVKTLTVSLLVCPEQPMLKQLARCLGALPHLLALHIIASTFEIQELERTFRNKTYPSIESLVLPANAYPIIQCCTGIRDIHVTTCHFGNPQACWLETALSVSANCPYAGVLEGFQQWQCVFIQNGTQDSPYAERVKELLPLTSG